MGWNLFSQLLNRELELVIQVTWLLLYCYFYLLMYPVWILPRTLIKLVVKTVF